MKKRKIREKKRQKIYIGNFKKGKKGREKREKRAREGEEM